MTNTILNKYPTEKRKSFRCNLNVSSKTFALQQNKKIWWQTKSALQIILRNFFYLWRFEDRSRLFQPWLWLIFLCIKRSGIECTFIDIEAIEQKAKKNNKYKEQKYQNANYSRAVKSKVGCVYAINMERCLDSRCLNWNFLVVSLNWYKAKSRSCPKTLGSHVLCIYYGT